jgi:hypothetical protein
MKGWKEMKELKVTFVGETPLILHSCQCVNPLHPIAIAIKKLTGKRTKTEEDYLAISDLEWEGGLYWDDKIGVYIPCENVLATIKNGAMSFKKGKDITKFVDIAELKLPLDYGARLTKEQLKSDYAYRDVRIMTVQRAKVNRTRPRFNTWKLVFVLLYDESHIDVETIANAIEYAGAYVGLCDSRPRYGKFAAKIEEIG